MHGGGISDKVGKRFEARWVTHHLLLLLDGSVSTITIESLGDEENAFEFSLVRGQQKEWHQCKRQSATGKWTIPRLASEGVLSGFARKLTSEDGRCVFVSTDPAPELKRLIEKTPATVDVEDFEKSLPGLRLQTTSILIRQRR